MHISIAGRLGSGKSTICNILKDNYGFRVYSTGAIQREIALEHKISTLEMNNLMAQDLSYDYAIDDAVTKISMDHKDETIIFDSRMAWKFAVNSFKIFVTVDPHVAAQRVMNNPRGAEEIYSDLEDAKLKLIERGRLENERFIDIYSVNNFDYGNYNLIIDSTYAAPEELAELVYVKFQAFCKSNGEKNDILISPTSLYPNTGIKNIDSEKLNGYIGNKEYLHNYVTIAVLDGYHYIIDGHHRVLAAIANDEKFVNVNIIDKAKRPNYASTKDLISEIQAIDISLVHDFENIGKFRYKSYPRHFNQAK